MSQQRTYRNRIHRGNLTPYHLIVKETDLLIHSSSDLRSVATECVLQYRGYVEAYIEQDPAFANSLVPYQVSEMSPAIVKEMARAGQNAGVGPMAAVAGAIAQFVGNDLLAYSSEIITENGGDVFIKTDYPVTVGIYAGDSPLSFRIGFSVDSSEGPIAVCTSSGTVGHSLSLGSADAVCVKSGSCAIADAAATAIGNYVNENSDIQRAVEFGQNIKGIDGIVVIRKDSMGVWGDLEIVEL